jgi:hypothetical protein
MEDKSKRRLARHSTKVNIDHVIQARNDVCPHRWPPQQPNLAGRYLVGAPQLGVKNKTISCIRKPCRSRKVVCGILGLDRLASEIRLHIYTL